MSKPKGPDGVNGVEVHENIDQKNKIKIENLLPASQEIIIASQKNVPKTVTNILQKFRISRKLFDIVFARFEKWSRKNVVEYKQLSI